MPRHRATPPRLCLLLAAAAPLLAGNTATGGFETRVLAAHNRERLAGGVAPLAWNAGLALSARQWADHLAATGTFKHAPDKDATDPQGENLWAGTKGRFAVERMVYGWIEEKQHFKPGLFPDNSKTGRVADVGHYTQLMWHDTREVGCAVARGAMEDVLVCRYSRAGNWEGERPF